jgi:branched-chain amino acid transport system substrate-binding protein
MLPSTGTFAALGDMIENGFKLHVEEQGGKLGGRSRSSTSRSTTRASPSKATDNVNKLIKRDNVDVIVGTVHSGVALAMARAAKDSGTLLIVPNAGRRRHHRPAVRAQHLPQLVQQLAAGLRHRCVAAQKGYKRAMTITWNYAAGTRRSRASPRPSRRAAARWSRT